MKLKDAFANSLVSFFGVGYVPIASGTWASLVCAVFAYWFWPDTSTEIKLAVIAILFTLGCFFATYVEKRDRAHDPSMVVLDEVIGMLIASILLPQIWWHWIMVFFLFRFFDIAKIWPASFFDKRKGGFSIMFDDVIAAAYAILSYLVVSSQL